MRIFLVCFFLLINTSAFCDDYTLEGSTMRHNGYKITLQYENTTSYVIPYALCYAKNGGSFSSSYFPGANQVYIKGGWASWGAQLYALYSIVSAFEVDADNDGLEVDYDPCPDTPDNYIKHYLAPNSCDGSYYFFQLTGECGETKNYYNPKYSSINEAYQDAIDNPDCSATPEVKSVTPQQVQNFFDSNTGQNTASSGSGVIPEDSVDLTGGNSTSTSPQEVTSDNPDTQKVIDAIKVMRETVEETLNKQTQKIIDSENLAADRIVSTLKSGNNLVSGRLSGVENAINALKGNTASYADQAHIDALATISAINSIGVNGTGSGSGGSENGTGTGETGEGNGTASGNGTGEYGTAPVVEYSIPKEEDRPTFYNATLENDREQAAKNDLMNSWNKLTQRVETFLNLSLSGTGSLPVWDWNILGNIITIDFRDFEEIFKLIGLAILFIAAIRAFFIVFD